MITYKNKFMYIIIFHEFIFKRVEKSEIKYKLNNIMSYLLQMHCQSQVFN